VGRARTSADQPLVLTRRWCEAPGPLERATAWRVLVCRYRPRGVRRGEEAWDLWWSELEFMGVDPTGFGDNATRAFDLTIPG